MNNITINDIAQATGFSANTVSRALRDKPDISQETDRRFFAVRRRCKAAPAVKARRGGKNMRPLHIGKH